MNNFLISILILYIWVEILSDKKIPTQVNLCDIVVMRIMCFGLAMIVKIIKIFGL